MVKAERLTRAVAEDPYLSAVFPVLAEYPLPDGSHGILRARRVPPVRDVTPAELARRLQKVDEAALADYVRDVEGLRITLDYRPDAIREGLVDRVRVEANVATVGELRRENRTPLRVRDVRVLGRKPGVPRSARLPRRMHSISFLLDTRQPPVGKVAL